MNIVEKKSLKDLSKGPKYRKPQFVSWKYNIKLLIDSVEDYAIKWAKRQKENVDSDSEWLKAVNSTIQIIISNLKTSMSTSDIKNLNVSVTMFIIMKYMLSCSR